MTLRIRDSFAVISGDKTEYEMPSGGLEIIADDGRPMFCIRYNNGHLEISGGMVCKFGDKLLSDAILVSPRACNLIYVYKPEYGEEP